MRKLLTDFINLIFPPRVTEKKIQNASNNSFKPMVYEVMFEYCIYLSEYQKQTIQAAIIENKFHRNTKATKLLAQVLDHWTQQQTVPTLYIPIPLGPKRLKERGYNQVLNILNFSDFNLEIENNVLSRKSETTPQTKLKKKDRVNNMKNVFLYTEPKLSFSKYKQIVIVDDVITTGATLNEARATLSPHLPPNIKLICLAIAH